MLNIGLFVPCYVDAVYPEVGVATYRLLKSLGLHVEYPERQTCCGQPMGNAGFEHLSVPLAKKFDELFGGYDYVVAPSASCTAYVRCFHPHMLGKKPEECEAAGKTTDLGLVNQSTFFGVSGNETNWLAAANCAGSEGGKLLSPQSIAIATAACDMEGRDGAIMRQTMPFAIFWILMNGLMVFLGLHVF